MAADESPWQRGSEDIPAAAPIAFERFTVSDGTGIVADVELDAEPDGSQHATAPRRRGRWLTGFVAIIALGIAAVFVAARVGGDDETDRPDIGAIDGADDRQLPRSSDRLWSTTIPTDGLLTAAQPQLFLDGRDALVSLVDRADGASSLGVAFDPVDGTEIWRREFPFTSASANLLGVLDGVLVVERNDLDERQLIGIAATTGATAWSLSTRDNGVHVILSGTNVITRVSFTGNERLTFVDPSTGEEINRTVGRLISTDLSGTWHVLNDRRVFSIDLSDSVTDPVDVITDVAIGERPIAVIDGRPIVVDVDGTLAEVDPNAPGDDPFIPLVAVGADLPDIVSLVPSGGSTFIAIGGGKVIGATLAGRDVQVQWEFDGSVQVVGLSAGGLLVGIRDAVGFEEATQVLVIDGVTGDELAVSSATRDQDVLPLLLGNGFITTDDSGLGFERIGIDLDGREQWRLAANEPIRVGDRIVVTSSVNPDAITITAFGDST